MHTVHLKNYAHVSHFVVVGYRLILQMFGVTSLALGQSPYDLPSVSEVTLKNMDKNIISNNLLGADNIIPVKQISTNRVPIFFIYCISGYNEWAHIVILILGNFAKIRCYTATVPEHVWQIIHCFVVKSNTKKSIYEPGYPSKAYNICLPRVTVIKQWSRGYLPRTPERRTSNTSEYHFDESKIIL